MMRRGLRMSLGELAPYLLETASPRSGLERAEHPHLHPQEPSSSIAPLDWPGVFGNANPVEIEVGFGKGLFLVNSGMARPHTNFFGIEIERKYTLFTATRLAKRGLRNVKLAACDARWFMETYVPTGSVAALHVFFPDPWWKNRHRKRRLFTETFAVQCARVLSCGGVFNFASDVEKYFAESASLLTDLGAFEALPPPVLKNPEHEMDFLTNFERKYRQEGRAIQRGVWRRK